MKKKNTDTATETKILEAAKKVFVRDGMAGARMQDIADEAGINKALLHYYFRNKEKLFERIFLDAAHQIFPRVNAIFQADQPLFEKIEEFIDTYITIVMENPYLPLFVLTEINRDPVRFLEKIWPNNSKPDPLPLLKQIQQEVEEGNIKPIDPASLIVNMMSLVVFPFVGRPMIQHMIGMDQERFADFLQQRKKSLTKFIIDAIKA
ncbi:MAG: TetR/AcrR family transcriptional regulator [Chitinophagaceae bacterium]